jgi:ABC-type enterochelin transport system permease subunit
MNTILFETTDFVFIAALLSRIPQEFGLLIAGLALAATAMVLRSVLRNWEANGSVGHETE